MVFEVVEILKIFLRFSKAEKVIVNLKVANYVHVEFIETIDQQRVI